MIYFPDHFPQAAAEFFARTQLPRDGETIPLKMHFGCHTLTRRGEDVVIEEAPAARCAELPPPPTGELAPLNRFQQPGQIIVISLAHRADRRARLMQNLREIGWPFAAPQFLDAVDGSKVKPPRDWRWTRGAWGCLVSHRMALERARDSGFPEVMVLEDDVHFLPGFAQRIREFLRAVPEDWQMLMPGGRHYKGHAARKGARRAWDMVGTECYAVRGSVLPEVCARLAAGATDQIDNLLGRHQRDLRAYAAHPRLAQQVEGFSDIVLRERTAAKEPDAFVEKPSAEEGAIILSTGAGRRLLLVNAAASVRRVHPHLGIQLITDVPLPGYDCRVVTARTGNSSREHKTQLLIHSPFQLGVILDDDTICVRPIRPISEILGEADIALAQDPWCPTIASALAWGEPARWVRSAEVEYMRGNYGELDQATHYNSGVIFFRKTPAVIELTRVWHEEWQRFRGVDQMALYRALHKTGLRVQRIPEELHARPGRRVARPAIMHFTGSKRASRVWMEAAGIPYITETAPVPVVTPGMLHFKGGKTFRVSDGKKEQIESRPRSVAAPEVWGPPAWRRLHRWALDSAPDVAAREKWLSHFAASLPVCDCKSHWREMLARTPAPLAGDVAMLFAWTVARHNEVNVRKGKPEMTLDAALAIYQPSPSFQAEHGR